MLFDSGFDVLRVLIVSALAYVALLITLRFAGKRSLAKLNAFDSIITVAFGSSFATVLLTKDVAVVEGVVAFIMLATLQWVVSRLSLLSPRFKKAVRSQPTLLLRDGSYLKLNMESERVTRSDVSEAVRKSGIGRLEDVAAVVLETDGSMSVIGRGPEAPTLLDDVRK